MCGIITIYNEKNRISKNVLTDITQSLKHRGPCSNGVKTELGGRLGIGNTRLALVDLHDRSDQPLEIENFIITFNGEIYNHKELRKELQGYGYNFKTTSDTEVIIRSFQKWGVKALNRFNGCFAFSLFDKKSKKLVIARDPIGKKQIVYTKASNGDWVFASEIKALLKHPFVKAEPNIGRFIADLVFKFFSDKKETHFKNIYHVLPGHYFIFNLKKGSKPQIKKYWDIDEIVLENYTKKDIPSVVNNFEKLLRDSVRLRMDADAEVGSIVSGGIDSSLITKIASEYHNQKYKKPFHCFTIKYDYGENKDLKNAKLLCGQMKNVKLHEIEIKNDISIDELDEVTFSLEEPLLDKVFIPQFKNYEYAKKAGLRAVINGQGADELWLGYLFFYDLLRLPVKDINYQGLKKYWMQQFKFYNFVKSKKIKGKIDQIIERNLKKNFIPYKIADKTESLVNFSIKTHLQAMFMQEDRLSMANSVEVRLPHVDLRIIKLALSAPSLLKTLDKREKYILRKLGKKLLPREIYMRKKMAFPDPPNQYDRKTEAIFDKKEIFKSKILGEIFQGNTENFFYKLPLRSRWELLAISRMEKIFFNK